MKKKVPGSKCLLCNSMYTKTGMTRHLKSCIKKETEKLSARSEAKQVLFFHIQVSGYYLPEYWMHLKVESDAELQNLDQFLRDIWLECCHHMSAFRTKTGELDMGMKIRDVFSPGMELLHEYDFGSTTELLIRVFDEYEGFMKDTPVQLLARNVAPKFLCDECKKAPAIKICTECQWEGRGMLCKECAKKHSCGEEMLLPVVNSPRCGVCAYTG